MKSEKPSIRFVKDELLKSKVTDYQLLNALMKSDLLMFKVSNEDIQRKLVNSFTYIDECISYILLHYFS